MPVAKKPGMRRAVAAEGSPGAAALQKFQAQTRRL
jgi:hypothetical protein